MRKPLTVVNINTPLMDIFLIILLLIGAAIMLYYSSKLKNADNE